MSRFIALKTRWLEARRERARRVLGAAKGDEARRFNRLAEAATAYEAYLKQRPSDLGVQLRLIGVLREAGRLREALQRLETLANARPDKLKIRLILAETLDESGALERARDIYADVLRIDPSNVRAGDALEKIVQTLTIGETALPEPPALLDVVAHVHVRIETAGAAPEALAATLRSIEDLSVSSVRLSISESAEPSQSRHEDSAGVLHIKAGTTLKMNAISWLLWAIRQGAIAAYADHEGADGEPMLQSAPDPLDLATNPHPPGLIMFAPTFGGAEMGIAGLERALAEGPVMHLPVILSRSDGRPTPRTASQTGSPGHERLLVVIPTRDAAAEVEEMVLSLARLAAQPQRLDVVVVDNGSQPPLLSDSFAACGAASVNIVRIDEPFNWSRLNNRACEGRTQPIIIFANDDMEMLTNCWDDKLRTLFNIERVGVAGARLLYPNGLLQHGGIVLGGLNGEPLHDGWRAEPHDRGPLDRWIRRRPASAVTGGFMAVRRAVFEAIGGFDEVQLPISCSDVDLCLKAGARGWSVVYAPEIEIRHHESLTRGHAHDEAARLRAESEMRIFLARWGRRAAYDPARNPQWETRGVRLYAGRKPLTTDQVTDWAVKTASRPRTHTLD